jgi:hypothetical protein
VLQGIVKKHLNLFKTTVLKYQKLATIGTNKFMAAHYQFSAGEDDFMIGYHRVMQDFLAAYSKSYFYYGNTIIPHISVAQTSNPTQAYQVTTTQCQIADVKLLHAGRKMYVAGSYYDPSIKQIRRLDKVVI